MELNHKERKRLRVLPPLTAPLLGRGAPAPADTSLGNTLLVWEVPRQHSGIRWGSGSEAGAPDAPSPGERGKVAMDTVGRGLRASRTSDALRRRRQARRAVGTRMEPEQLIRKISVLQVGGWGARRGHDSRNGILDWDL